MKVLIVASALLAVACAVPDFRGIDRDLDEHWAAFKQTHDKHYTLLGEEYGRRVNFERNVKKINDHNVLFDLGLVSYRLGLNKYSDMSQQEFNKKFNGFRAGHHANATDIFRASGKAVPDTVDWRDKGYVTPIKDQAQCGSCWAFSSTGSIEGQVFAKTGKLISFSEQQLVDCSTAQGNAGCGGGWMDQAFQYVQKAGGIETEQSYPYTAVDGNCKFNKNAVAAQLTGYTDIQKTEDDLKVAVATFGPISVAIDATGFFSYKSGIFDDANCQQNAPDHAVLVVGYGSENGVDFWIVKNSWGTSWGEKGYIRMHRNYNNLCGIANYATFPKV